MEPFETDRCDTSSTVLATKEVRSMARSKEFDPEVALEAAMRSFWPGGYEATSTQTLCERMSIGKRSLYDTYGDKRSLYLAALRSYLSRLDAREELVAQSLDADDALSAILIPDRET